VSSTIVLACPSVLYYNAASMDGDQLLASLGHRVRRLRAERGLTVNELAARSKLSPRFVAQVESGAGNISVRRLSGLAHALGTTPAALLTEPDGAALPVIALLGLRGAGKSTIGRRLARRLKLSFVELDRRVEEAAGLSLAEIFALHGEDYYRRLEREALERILDDARPLVLATGGGLVASPDTYTLLRTRALTVWLKADAEDHWNRVVQQGDRRPMADHPQAMADLRRLLASREPLYAEASHTVDTSRLGIDGVVRAVEGVLPGWGSARIRPGRPPLG
jgi:XRE family transcriptional regulator, aerobic/anaerobic benzoate catabolism transcriptional regulator